MNRLLICLLLAFIWITAQAGEMAASAPNGLIVKASSHSVSETIDRLEEIVKKKGITVFLRLDHAAGAKKVGKSLRPTELLIFGNPKLGSPLMMSNQSVGIDLPLKAIAWEDNSGKVWLAYNNPEYIAQRHQIEDQQKVIKKMTGALNKFTDYATGK